MKKETEKKPFKFKDPIIDLVLLIAGIMLAIFLLLALIISLQQQNSLFILYKKQGKQTRKKPFIVKVKRISSSIQIESKHIIHKSKK